MVLVKPAARYNRVKCPSVCVMLCDGAGLDPQGRSFSHRLFPCAQLVHHRSEPHWKMKVVINYPLSW